MKKVLGISLLAFFANGSNDYGSNSIADVKAYQPQIIVPEKSIIGANLDNPFTHVDADEYAEADPQDFLNKKLPGKGRPGAPGPAGPPGPPGPPGKCSCNRKKPRNFDYGQSKNLDYLHGDGGYGVPLSGNSGYGYRPEYNAMPARYNDGYAADQNANVYAGNLPKGSLLDHNAIGGYGGGGSYSSHGSINRVNSHDIGNKNGIGYGGKNHHGSGYGGGERAHIGTGNAEHKKADLHINADIDLEENGYNQALEYQGDSLYSDAAAKKESFNKGEAYVSEGFAGYDKESTYGGNAIYQQDDVATDLKVAYEVDHSLKFRNDYTDENHRGSYQGDEFEVDYSVTDVQGGYSGKEVDRQHKKAAYEGAEANGDFHKGGKYYGDDYMKYGDEDKDVDYRARGHGYPDGYKDGNYEGGDYYYDEPDLYARFKGDKKGGDIDFGKGKHGGDGYGRGPYSEHYRIDEDKSKDTGYRAYGADFEGKDYFGKKYDAEAYSGAEEKLKENIAYDKGNYRDVKAKGKNNAAQYAGDYQTNKKAQDVDFKVYHDENLYQDLKQDVKTDQYVAGYNGNDFKGALEADRKRGKYEDQELIYKKDARHDQKRYRGDEHSNGVSKDAEANLYYGAEKHSDQNSHLKAHPAGYRGEDTRKKDYSPHDFNNGNYGYMDFNQYSRHRRLAEDELEALKAQVASLQLSKIASKRDVFVGIGALLAASIIGSLTFVGIMHLNGYKAKKVANRDFESLESEN